jgi:hypothetical protein
MNAYHLRREEVEYELKIRNISAEGTAADNRKKLSQCLRNNTEVVADCVDALDPEQELEICNEKLQDLTSLIAKYEGTFEDNEYQRIVTRLGHLYSRIGRIPEDDSSVAEAGETKENLMAQTKKVIDDFKAPRPVIQLSNNTIETEKKGSEGQIDHLLQNLQINLESGKSVDYVQAIGPSTSNNPNSEKMKPNLGEEQKCYSHKNGFVPVYKWGLQFSNTSGQSIGSFLQRVEELRHARGLTEAQLFKSAVDLFSGSALIWYRSTVGRITNWSDLCREMKEVFQTPDYDDMLLQEIMNRRQGEQESIDLYIASMEGLYSRLSTQKSEDDRLKQMLKNLNRYLQEKLCLFPIVSISQLRTLGRKAELGRLRAANCQSMSSTAPVLEPDLAYRKSPSIKPRVAELSYPKTQGRLPSKLKCWNCSEEGHRHTRCTKPRNVFCYGCGAKNVKKTECSSCCPKNG